MWALDTNLLVRLLVDDDRRQTDKVQRWLEANATPVAPVYVDHIVLCELAWVLARSYGYARAHVHAALQALLSQQTLRLEAPGLVSQALALYAKGPADFSDYLLALRARQAGYAPVLTLDRNAAKGASHELLR